MSAIHFILQGKGGVGKSLVATLLAQYLEGDSKPLLCIDTDPVNKTFAAFQALNVHPVHLMRDDEIEPSMFDKLMRLIADHEGHNIILDNGAASFIPLGAYLVQNDMITTLSDMGFSIYIHTVITGGQAMTETVKGLNRIAQRFPADADIVVWKNEFFGLVEVMDESNGTAIQFEQTTVFDQNESRIMAIVTLQKQPQLFEKDVQNMMTLNMTFKEVEACKNKDLFDFIKKNRLKKFKNSVFSQLDVAFGVA